MSSISATITLNEEQVVQTEVNSDSNLRKNSPPEYYGTNACVNQTAQKKTLLEENLSKLARLISNITESHTAAIFVADQQEKVLHSLAHHSLSRDYIEGISIPYGRGLVGWTAENKVRITVCPFEHDSSTLLYYPTDQALKSFIAVPILNKNEDLIGVIACDSKKNYAFAKITEKILTECAIQAQIIIDLHLDNQKLSQKSPKPNLASDLENTFLKLKTAKSEEQLFEILCDIPQDLITRDAMITLITSHEGFGESKFYSRPLDSRIEHHLIDLVCKHKKVISNKRSLVVLQNEEIKARSFLSVPVNVYGRDAGALNVLSAPFKGFSPTDIEALEKLATCVGAELERLRSKTIVNTRQIGPSLLPWKHFINQSNTLLGLVKGEDGNKNSKDFDQYQLTRVQLKNLFTLEQNFGVKNLAEIHEQILRFIQQLAPQPMLASAPYGTSVYLFGKSESLTSVTNRLANLISKIPFMNNLDFNEKLPENAAEIIAANLDIRNIKITKGISSLEESIKYSSTSPTSIEVKKPTAAQIPQNQTIDKSQHAISNHNKNQNSFDKRLSQALKTQDYDTNDSIKGKSEGFILGEINEEKEVANARFW